MATAAKSKTTALGKDHAKSCSLEEGVISFLFTVFRQISIFCSVYMIGYMGWSIAWVIPPVVLAVAREQHRKASNSMRKMATNSEREVFLANCEELPSWVYFPDVDRCEWLNCIIKQLWPGASHYICDLVKNEIEPQLKYSLDQYHVKGFGFDQIVLGGIPPRIAGIKVYEKTIRNEIMMDLELHYCSSCDITFHFGTVSGGIKDFHFHCYARVVFKPLISTMPYVGGMQICLLRYPEIDFTISGILEMANLPFFGDLIRKLIAEQIAAVMVLPNKFTLILNDQVSSMDIKMSEPEGILRIHVIGAKKLTKGDSPLLGTSQCDPYAMIYVGAEKFQTQSKEKDLNPIWDYWCDAKVFAELGQTVVFEVWCKDNNKSDDFMGRVTVDLRCFVQTGPVDKWLQLEDVRSGDLHVSMQWYKLSRNPEDIKTALQDATRIRKPELSSAVVTVFIGSAENVKQARSDSLPDSYVICSVKNQSQETRTIQHTTSPVWEESFSFLVEDPYQETLLIKVKDKKSDSVIGECEIYLCAILECEDLQTDLQTYSLRNSSSDSKLAMALSLKILAHFEATEPLYFECHDDSDENISRKVGEIKRKQPPASMPTLAPFQYDYNNRSSEQKFPVAIERENLSAFPKTTDRILHQELSEQKYPVVKEKITITRLPKANDKLLPNTQISHQEIFEPSLMIPELIMPERNYPKIPQIEITAPPSTVDINKGVTEIEWEVPRRDQENTSTPKILSLTKLVVPISPEQDPSIIVRDSTPYVESPETSQVSVLKTHEPPSFQSPGKTPPAASKTTPLLKYTTSTERRMSAHYEKEFELRVSTADLHSLPSINRLASASNMPNPNELPRIELSMRYSLNREKLAVVIHRAKNLPMADPYNLPDPFVKLYILPDRTKKSRRRTQVIRENCNPVFEATFEYELTMDEVKKSEMELSVCSQKDLMTDPNTILGVLVIPLDEPEIRKGIIHCWFDLNGDNKKSK